MNEKEKPAEPLSQPTQLRFAYQNGETASAQDAPTENTRRRRVLPIHPILFALFPMLALLAHNFNQTPFHQTILPFGLALLFAIVVWAIFQLFTRQARKSAAATATIVLVFFSYTHVYTLLPEPLRVLVFPVSLLLVVGLLTLILRSRQPLYDTTSVLNFTSLVLVVPSLWTIAMEIKNAPPHSVAHVANASGPQEAQGPHAGSAHWNHPMASASANLPDIYYIILDAYGRDDRLQQFYGFDNTPFLKELERRGFYIARKSGANYDQTPLALSSALNMNYLDTFHYTLSPEVLRRMVDDSAVAHYLEKQGYHYIDIWSGLEVSRVTTADLIFNDESDLSGFEGQALNLTALGMNTRLQHSRFDKHRDRIRGVFDNLDTVARLPYPKFVFAHALAPHPPFVFGPEGESVYPGGQFILADASELVGENETQQMYIRGYTGQLQYVNKRVLQAVDAILKQSRRPPIIILQGDHGSRMTLNWESEAKTDLREPFSIFNAYYVPKKVRNELYDTITPINSFRIVLNQLFGTNYPRLPDCSFYSTASHPYQFTDVTALIPLAHGPASTTPTSASGRIDDETEH